MKETKDSKPQKKEQFKTKKKDGKRSQKQKAKNHYKKNKIKSTTTKNGNVGIIDDLSSNGCLQNKEHKKNIKNNKTWKLKKNNSIPNKYTSKKTQKKENLSEELYYSKEKGNSAVLNNDDDDDIHYYKDKESVHKNEHTDIHKHNEKQNSKNINIKELGDINEEYEQTLQDTTGQIQVDNELHSNIYLNRDDDEYLNNEEENNINNNLQKEQKQIDYISYMEEVRNIKQNEENKQMIRDTDINRNEENTKKKQIFKVFLLFAPLSITTIKGENYLINADDHLEMFENKKKKLQDLWTNEKNPRKKKEWENKIEKINNNLKNCRSDAVFFTLLSLRDSILNKHKKLQVYIYTINNLLIYVSPEFHVPRNFFLFKKVMTTLLTKNVVYDNEKNILLQVLRNPIGDYVQNSICVGVSNKGFPADAKKFADKVKDSNKDYSFFFSLSNMYDVTDTIQKDRNHNNAKWNKRNNEQFLCAKNNISCSYHYYIRISDLPISPVIACSKLTYFLV